MFEIKIKNKYSNEVTNRARFETELEANEWVEKNKTHRFQPFGKIQREILKTQEHDPELVSDEWSIEVAPEREEPVYEMDEQGNYVYSQILDGEGNVVSRELIPTGEMEIIPAVIQEWVRVEADYQVLIEDLSVDTDYLLEKCQESRRNEYPEISDQLDKLYKCLSHLKLNGMDLGIDGDSWLEEIKIVKNKYQKPIL